MATSAQPALPMLPPAAPPRRADEEYRIVCVRMRASEFEQFSGEIKALNLTGSMALRIAARRIGGFLEVDQQFRRQLEAGFMAIGEVSAAVRALHAAAAAGGGVDLAAMDAQRAAFGREFAQIDSLLRSILNVSRRRADGRRLLSEATQ